MAVIDPEIEGALAAAEAALEVLRGADFALLGNADRLAVLERLEHVGRTIPGIGHELVAELTAQRAEDEFPYGGMSPLLAGTLNVRFGTARRMLSEASLLADRAGLSGAPLPPIHPLVGGAQRAGLINADHVAVILKFFGKLPSAVSAQDRQSAEEQLVECAKTLRPDQLEAVARRLMALLNPDGSLDDERERRKDIGLWMGPQDSDGLTRGTFCIGARLRAFLEALFAKFAKPGICNPEDQDPLVIAGPVDPPPEPPPEPEKPRRRSKRTCPMCGGPVGEDGKAGTAPADDEGPADGEGQDGHPVGRRGRCSGKGHGLEQERDQEQRPDPCPSPEPEPEPQPQPPEPSPELDPQPELEFDLPPALTPPSGAVAPAANGVDASALADAAAGDLRPWWLRNADALEFVLGSALSDPRLGRHRGLPVTAVITMTLKDLEAATGKAISGGGSIIPIRDAIRMASHAHPYLLIFDDDGRPLYLGRGKRLATADQRLVLYAGDRGCTHPGCPRPGYLCETHHIDEWAADHGRSDIDRLTFACDMHHPLIGHGPDDWTTSTAPPGGPFGLRTLWHPPALWTRCGWAESTISIIRTSICGRHRSSRGRTGNHRRNENSQGRRRTKVGRQD